MSMLRNPFAALRQAALLMALGAQPGRARPMSPEQGRGQVRVASDTKAGRRMTSRVYRNIGTFHRDHQRGASLRRRMGGNAERIRMAREGKVFDDIEKFYVESPTVLPEEVEVCVARWKAYDPKGWNESVRWGDAIRTEIRGHLVEVRATSCGPARFKVIKEKAVG